MTELLYALALRIDTDIPEEDLIAELQEALTNHLETLGVDIGYVGVSPIT